MILRLLFLISCTFPSAALAQKVTTTTVKWTSTSVPNVKSRMRCLVADPTRCFIVLQPGETAPFAGIHETFTQQAVLQVRADPERIQKRIDQEVKTTKRLADNDLKLQKKFHEIDNQTCKKNIEATEAKILEVAPEWYEEPVFVIPITAAVTIGLIAGGVAVICEVRGCK